MVTGEGEVQGGVRRGISSAGVTTRAVRVSRRSCVALGLAAGALLAACPPRETAPRQNDAGAAPVAVSRHAATLTPGERLEGTLAGDRAHGVRLALPADSFLHIEADTRGVDAVVLLRDTDGTELARLHSPARRWGAETLSAIVETAGDYRIEVRRLVTPNAEGTYRVEILELRPATDGDALRLEAERLHALGLELSENDRRETNREALARFREALPLWRQAGDRFGEARSRHWVGVLLSNLLEHQEAVATFEATLATWTELGREDFVAETLYRLGNVQADLGRYDVALELFAGAEELWRRLGDLERLGFTLNNQAWVFSRLTRFQGAIDNYRQAAAIFRQLGLRRREAAMLENLGATYLRVGESEELASERFAEALAVYEELDSPGDEATALNSLGWVHKIQGQAARSIPYFERALAIAEDLGDLGNQALFLDNLGRAYLDLGEARTALELSTRAYGLSLEANAPDSQTVRLTSIAAAERALGRPEAAAERLTSALALSRRYGIRRIEAEALLGLAEIGRDAGDLDGALDRVEDAIEVVEAIRTDIESQRFRASYLGFGRFYYELYIDVLTDLAGRRPTGGYVGRALSASERARARSLLEILAEAGADLRAGVDPGLLERERALREALNRQAQERAKLTEESSEEGRAEREIHRLLGELDLVEREIRRNSPKTAALARPQPLTLAEIQRKVLDGETLLLEVALGEERSHLWAVTTASIKHHDLPPRAEIETAARRVYELLTDAHGWMGTESKARSERFHEAARELSAMLLVELGDALDARRLLIVAEGALQYLPFAALPAPGMGEGRPLVLDHEVVHLPSASTLAVLRAELADRPPAPRTLMALADPVFQPWDPRLQGVRAPRRKAGDGGSGGRRALWRSARGAGLGEFPRLASSGREAERIADLVPPEERRLALGLEASRELALSEELSRYRFLHFATHGILNDRNPELSGLVLSLFDERGEPRDGFLRLHEVYALDLKAELVVLSACQTGLGREVRGEGLIGLTRGFMYAGARRVVASLWKVEDRATAELMERFYRGMLERGMAPARALRAAQVEMLQGEAGERWSLPYFWAPFVLHGDWR